MLTILCERKKCAKKRKIYKYFYKYAILIKKAHFYSKKVMVRLFFTLIKYFKSIML
jgi:hypothetical protein